jgi:hypothetical protein
MNLWLNKDPTLWKELEAVTGYNDVQLYTFLYDSQNSKMWAYVTGTLMTNVYAQYKDTLCKSDLSV